MRTPFNTGSTLYTWNTYNNEADEADARTTLNIQATEDTCKIVSANSRLNRADTDPYAEMKIQSVIGHEFGHGIGMRHFQDGCVTRSIMQHTTGCRWGQLGIQNPQSIDIALINQTY